MIMKLPACFTAALSSCVHCLHIYCCPAQRYKSLPFWSTLFKNDETLSEEKYNSLWIKIIEYDSHYRNKHFHPSCDLVITGYGDDDRGGNAQRLHSCGRNTAHCVERPSLNSAAVSLQRARLIQNANLTDINVGTATCLRMEQKCLLFFFSTLRSNL